MDVLAHIAAFVLVLIHWRVLACLTSSIVIGVLLSRALDWFTAGFCISLVIVGVTLGLWWQGRAEAGVKLFQKAPPTSPQRPLSRPVVLFALAFLEFFARRSPRRQSSRSNARRAAELPR